jgi:predicted DNA-binding ribbon-helix-helix protein
MCQVFAGQDPDRYTLTTRRLRLNGQSTSIRLENAFWTTLDHIAAADGMTTPAFISRLHAEVLENRGEPVNFTSLLRTACLVFVAQASPTDHHAAKPMLAAE